MGELKTNKPFIDIFSNYQCIQILFTLMYFTKLPNPSRILAR